MLLLISTTPRAKEERSSNNVDMTALLRKSKAESNRTDNTIKEVLVLTTDTKNTIPPNIPAIINSRTNKRGLSFIVLALQ
jgi:hypothetical protein